MERKRTRKFINFSFAEIITNNNEKDVDDGAVDGKMNVFFSVKHQSVMVEILNQYEIEDKNYKKIVTNNVGLKSMSKSGTHSFESSQIVV